MKNSVKPVKPPKTDYFEKKLFYGPICEGDPDCPPFPPGPPGPQMGYYTFDRYGSKQNELIFKVRPPDNSKTPVLEQLIRVNADRSILTFDKVDQRKGNPKEVSEFVINRITKNRIRLISTIENEEGKNYVIIFVFYQSYKPE